MIIDNVWMALLRTTARRLLSYHIISQVGYISVTDALYLAHHQRQLPTAEAVDFRVAFAVTPRLPATR
jgi:formate hydrogenlyase subunit 3/multisubunit Na+/H+ antiporter MnhD subunit